MRRHLRSDFGDNDRGAVLPIVALSLVVLMVMTAFSVDIGRQIVRRREAQAVADVMALDLVRQVDGRTRSVIESDPQWDQTRQDGAARNSFPASGVTAILGHWDRASQVFTSSAASDVPDAVKVIANDVVNFYFARVIGINQGNVSRSAVATQVPPTKPPCTPPPPCVDIDTHAGGELGSVFAGFQYYNQPGMSAQYNLAAELRAKVLNSTIFTQFGMSGAAGFSGPPVGLNLDALSYKGISNGSVRLGDLASTLGFGSVDDLLNATITARQLLTAEATVLQASSNVADVTAGNKIATFATAASSSSTLQLRKFIKIEQGQGNRAANLHVNALHLITGSGEVINGKSFFSTTISTNIPGVPTLPIRVAVIQPEQTAYNREGSGPCTDADYASGNALPDGCGPRTSQVRIAADIPFAVTLAGVPVTGTIPVVFEAAVAQGYFTTIRCAQPTSNSKTNYRVVTNGLSMSIGSVSDASLQSTTTMNVTSTALLSGSVLGVNLSAGTTVSESKTFKNGAVYSGQLASNAGVLGADETHLFTGNLPTNILPTSWRYAGGISTNITTNMLGTLGITGPFAATINSALATELANLDTFLADPGLSSFGISIAGADGAITVVDCNVHLVQ